MIEELREAFKRRMRQFAEEEGSIYGGDRDGGFLIDGPFTDADIDSVLLAILTRARDVPLEIKLAGANAITAEHMKTMANYDAADDCWQAMIDAAMKEVGRG